jgi:hypothetical protein
VVDACVAYLGIVSDVAIGAQTRIGGKQREILWDLSA